MVTFREEISSLIYLWEGKKGLILWRWGKLNSTHSGKLQQPQQVLIMHCGCRNARATEMHEMEHSISCIAAATNLMVAAAMHVLPQCTRWNVHTHTHQRKKRERERERKG